MTQLEIAAIAVGAFALFMFGYSLGWLQRARLARRRDELEPRFDAGGSVDECLEARARRVA
ncbi:hypothetical protein [Bradyrhizobium elkanii]|uniref:hypothetical protein n=1 Tax=Bradyrhizobium elkanii TaxID=29448 RepID=UPI00084207A6|nr:hypothetical protein [Bradyrhizobium elkanii]ODM77775.1 hypothetical protein A6452_34430 [Bradyrhizobium elkanii]ODM81769.1 hypothetical protein A6X20_19085 [Bradyrhizobium elkanii]